jgi:hypothetical protein
VAERVSDEVWRRLEACRRGLSRRWVRRLWIIAVTIFVLGFAGNLLWISPLVTPRLNAVSPTSLAGLERVGGDLRIRAVVENPDHRAVWVLDVGLASPGLELLRVEGSRVGEPSPFPVRLAGGERVAFTLIFRVVECTAVDVYYPLLLRATIERPWGEMVVGASGLFETSGEEEDLIDFWCAR